MFTGAVLSNEDVVGLFFPTRWWYAERLHASEPFWWASDLFGGYYIHGEGNLGMLHPVHLLLYRFLPAYAAFAMCVVLSYVALGIGSVFLFRQWRISRTAAGIGALLATFCGYSAVQFAHLNAIEVWAHVPWLLYFTGKLFQAPNGRQLRLSIAAIGLITLSMVLLSHPPFFFYSAVLEGSYVLYLWGQHKQTLRLASFIGAKVLGVLAGLVQLIPTWQMSRVDNLRGAPTFEFLSRGSLHPYELLQWMNPSIIGPGDVSKVETLLFWGTGTILLAVWGLLWFRTGNKPIPSLQKWLIVIGALGLLIAFGKYNGAYAYYYVIPPFSMFRVSARFLLLLHFAVTGLALLALDKFLAGEGSPRLQRRFTAVVSALIAISIGLLGLRLVQFSPLEPWLDHALPSLSLAILGCIMVCATAAVFLWASRSSHRWARQAAVCVMLLELVAFFGRIYVRFPVLPYQQLEANLPPVPAPGPVGDNQLYDQLLVNGYRLTGGYGSFRPQSSLGVFSEDFERLLGVQAVRREVNGPWSRTSYQQIPRIRLLADAIVETSPIRTIGDIDPLQVVLLEEPVSIDPSAVGSATVVEEWDGHFEVSTDTTGPMVAVLTERFHPGWQISSATGEFRLLPAYGDLLAFTVPPGQNTLTLDFVPPNLDVLMLVSGIFAAVLFALLIF